MTLGKSLRTWLHEERDWKSYPWSPKIRAFTPYEGRIHPCSRYPHLDQSPWAHLTRDSYHPEQNIRSSEMNFSLCWLKRCPGWVPQPDFPVIIPFQCLLQWNLVQPEKSLRTCTKAMDSEGWKGLQPGSLSQQLGLKTKDCICHLVWTQSPALQVACYFQFTPKVHSPAASLHKENLSLPAYQVCPL